MTAVNLVLCAVYISAEDAGSHLPGSPFLPFTGDHGEPLAIWVASAIDKIPPGSLIINPQTGKPYMNPDGSVYRWYPPTDKLASTSAASQPSPVEHSKVGQSVSQSVSRVTLLMSASKCLVAFLSVKPCSQP